MQSKKKLKENRFTRLRLARPGRHSYKGISDPGQCVRSPWHSTCKRQDSDTAIICQRDSTPITDLTLCDDYAAVRLCKCPIDMCTKSEILTVVVGIPAVGVYAAGPNCVWKNWFSSSNTRASGLKEFRINDT